MSQRLRLLDFRQSRGAQSVGLCQQNLPGLASMVNAAQRRLLYAKEAGDEGWFGTWAEMVFAVQTPGFYITPPRGVARVERAAACDKPIPVQNQFFEYLDLGVGPQSPLQCRRQHVGQLYSRNFAVTFTDLSNPPQNIIAYASDPRDIAAAKRVLLQGLDANNNALTQFDNGMQVQGQFITLESPFAVGALPVNSITGIQKDVTYGPVLISQLDPTTAAQVPLVTMEPGETTAWYRRYFLGDSFKACCRASNQVTAIVKLELVPAVIDTDYLLIQNLEALIHECQAIRYSEMDSTQAKQDSVFHHNQAIKLLMGEMAHYFGIDTPAVNIEPFGTAKLERLNISMR